jgi:hypothetical protein
MVRSNTLAATVRIHPDPLQVLPSQTNAVTSLTYVRLEIFKRMKEQGAFLLSYSVL